ncbi:MAG: 2Fe-2S iron-sulfur cluster-binding protein [Candidatus Omnitrophota bacterium]
MEKVTIDSRKIDVEAGTTILEAANELGIEIPTLCYHEALGPYGSCRVCMVEIVTERGSKLVTACTYPVWDGLVVKTDSEKVIEARKFIVELMLARCPNVDAIKRLAERLGVKNRGLATADENCILCGLCIRACKDMIGTSAISFANRGMERKVQTPFEEASVVCIGCGACAFVCPTGAIDIQDIEKIRKVHGNTDLTLAACKGCGKQFATVKELDYIKEKIDLPQEIFELCHKCKRNKLRRDMK